jgi:Fe-S cluster biosynthesis and repair protein YggX
MADSASRIEQFKKMANDDPNNELGHFSLGRAYLDAGNFTESATSLQRCLAINPKLSKAYQLLAAAMLKLGQRDQAIAQLAAGVKIAHERGDVMPKNDMLRELKELGAPVPELKSTEPEKPVGQGEVHCQRCGKVAPKMPSAPFSNAQGQEIFAKICATCWREWIGMGTKVINELRLPLNDPKAQKIFEQHMMEFLNLR